MGMGVMSCQENLYTTPSSDRGHADILKLLLSYWITDPDLADEYGMTAIITASQEGHVDAVNMLFNGGADLSFKNIDGETALMIASKNGHTDIVNYIKRSW